MKAPVTGGTKFDPHPAGPHTSICDRVIDLGLQTTSYKGEEKVKHQVYLRFQTPAERVEYEVNGEKREGPATIGVALTFNMGEKANLRKLLEGWRGRKFTDDEAANFDVEAILGKPCTINVTHNVKGDKTYANITSISGPMKGVPVPELEGEALFYDGSRPKPEVLEKLPQWLREKVKNPARAPAEESAPDSAPPPTDADAPAFVDDDIPF